MKSQGHLHSNTWNWKWKKFDLVWKKSAFRKFKQFKLFKFYTDRNENQKDKLL